MEGELGVIRFDWLGFAVVATAYSEGKGVKEDMDEATHWYMVTASNQPKKSVEQAATAEAQTEKDRHLSSGTNATSPTGTQLTLGYLRQEALKAQVYPKGTFHYFQPTAQKPTPEVPAWKKVVNAVVAAPAKTKAFLSDHSDDLTEVAEFAIEQYLTGSEPSEGTVSKAEASDAGRTLQRYGEQQNK